MNIKNLKEFRNLLIKNGNFVSDLEYTENNYDHHGNLIKESLPTITTDFCEAGLHEKSFYFVFIVSSKTFNIELFNEIKNKPDIKIYGFIDFNKTLYPLDDFDIDKFIERIKEDEYFQVQFDYKDISIPDLFTKYLDLLNIFKKHNAIIVNQLEINLKKEK